MVTIGEVNSTKCDLTIRVVAIYLLTIDVSLCSCSIDTHSVCKSCVLNYGNLERRIAVIDNLTVHNCKALGYRVSYYRVREDGSLTIINSCGVIQCYVVNVESILAVYVGLFNVVVVIVSCVSCTVINRNVDEVELIVLSLSCDVVPALVELEELTVTDVCSANVHLNVTSIVRNIQPEANSYCVCAINFREDKVQSVVTCLINLCEVTLNSQGVVTVLYLTGCSVYNRDIATLVLAMVPVVAISICHLAVRTRRTVLTIVCVDLPTCEVLILKVIDDFRALTQAEVSCCGNLTNCSCEQGCSCSNTFLTSSEVEAVDCTDVSIGECEGYIRSLQNNILAIICSGQAKVNCLAVRNCHVSKSKCQCVGHYNVDCMLTNNLAIIYELSCYIAKLTVRNEYAILDCTEGSVSELPVSIIRNVSCCTYKVRTNCGEANCGAGCEVVVLCRNCCTNELTCCRSSGDNEDTVCCITLCTVRGSTINLEFLTGTL